VYAEYGQMLIIIPVYLFAFWLAKSYSGILRLSTTRDISKIIFALSLGSALLAIISYLERKHNVFGIHFIPYSVIVVQFGLSSMIAVTVRLIVKNIFNEWFNKGVYEKKVMIFGAGRLGQITRNALLLDNTTNYKLVGFIDDNHSLQNKTAAGVPIYSASVAFEKIIYQHNVTEIILAIDKLQLPLKRKREIVDLCLPKKIKLKEVPSVKKWIHGQLSASEIKQVRIEDLLGRDEITLDHHKIIEGVEGMVILVTGAAGSIGSEIVRQLMIFNAHHVIMLDKAESDLYDLQNEIGAKYINSNFTSIVGDVTNEVKLRKIFENYSPAIVINAAAYKHVPLMEDFPCEAIRVNIGGTRILANLSVEFGVKKFVLVSTDKAVNPTNVMGASKRISEIYIQSLAQKLANSTQFITTRFGNVLGSNGSVIPLFKKQIENGGPVTVTHSEITRFFMTIPEACQLVLEASFMGKGGEIFVFDMGEPVKIYNLAEKMIFLSGFTPHEDIKIEITQLRPGEKLYEELLIEQEGLMPTYNDKIMIGKNVEYDHKTIDEQILNLLKNVDTFSNQSLVEQMKKMVPEYNSVNPYYTNESKETGSMKFVS
jgi:FlaA1/EpsC-like NDP-sugar epimerase